jgi:hypothetical protein
MNENTTTAPNTNDLGWIVAELTDCGWSVTREVSARRVMLSYGPVVADVTVWGGELAASVEDGLSFAMTVKVKANDTDAGRRLVGAIVRSESLRAV